MVGKVHRVINEKDLYNEFDKWKETGVWNFKKQLRFMKKVHDLSGKIIEDLEKLQE